MVNELLREFQKGVREQLDEKDFETHYNLGIAYKEMALHDEAVQEFRLAARDAGRALSCANLLGLCYLAKGMSKKEIADTICVSVKTVDFHCSRIMEKLQIHDRVELARFAIREGLVTP